MNHRSNLPVISTEAMDSFIVHRTVERPLYFVLPLPVFKSVPSAQIGVKPYPLQPRSEAKLKESQCQKA